MRSERWIWPGTYSRPAEPMPLARPNCPPFLVTHMGPLGPSVTYGMRSGSAGGARRGGRAAREEVGGKPAKVQVAIGGDALVVHTSSRVGGGHARPGRPSRP